MRPIQLKINAFGPYRGKIELDFTKFGSSSIFLVSGATGSGKTTIFDALTYALYNKSSGEVRDADMLKSQFATGEDLCFVELTFEIQNIKYRVKRSPKQIGPGERVKTRELPANVEFYREEDILATGIEANKRIEALLGLTYEQFRQIVLLPQGEFRRLLLSDSKEKENIFRNIFRTEEIQKFQENLNEKRKALKKLYEEYETKLSQSLSRIDIITLSKIEDEETDQLVDAMERIDYEGILKSLNRFIQADNKHLDLTKNQIDQLSKNIKTNEDLLQLLNKKEQLEKEYKDIVELKPKMEKIQRTLNLNEQAKEVQRDHILYESLQNETKELKNNIVENENLKEKIQKELTVLQNKEQDSKIEEEKLDDIRSEINKLVEEQKQLEELDEKEQKIRELEKKGKVFQEKTEKINDELKINKNEINKLIKSIQQIDIWRKELTEVENQYESMKETFATTKQQEEILENTTSIQIELANLLKEKNLLFEDYQLAQKKYEDARRDYFSNLAGVLVEELIEEEPCPVCGSTHHPAPIEKEINSTTKEDLQSYEISRDEKNTLFTESSAQIDQKAEQLEQYLTSLNTKFNLKIKAENYQEALSTAKEKRKELEIELLEFEQKISFLNESLEQEAEWRNQLDEFREIKQVNELKKVDNEKEYSSILEKIKEHKIQIKEIREDLNYHSVKEVVSRIDELQNNIETIQNRAKQIRKELNEKDNERVKVVTSIVNLNNQLTINQEKENKQKEKYEKLLEYYQLDENFTAFLIDQKAQSEYEKQIKAYDKDVSFTTRQLQETKRELEKYGEIQFQTLSEIKNKLESKKTQKKEKEEMRERLIRQASKNEDSYHEIKKNYEESKKVSEPLAIYEDLTEIASGSTKRTSYVSFERYVLSIYFSEILLAANQRFEKMTNQRYQLVRRKDQTKGRGADGLEINIFDRYSGKQRSVKSLSGGETFKASLALALGLSDVIQNQQGGVHVETLFIDEGFGTLDDDSLEMAIETLMELQATGRLIGIISHVGELKERISARILVENQKEGSTARIETD